MAHYPQYAPLPHYAPLPQYAPVPSGYYPEVDQLPHGAVALKDFSAPPPPAYAYPGGFSPPQAQQYAAPSYESQGFLYDARAVPVAAGPEALAPQHEGHQQQQLVPAAHQPLHPSLYVAALVLGMLSFVLFWPLSFVGLGLAWRAMKKIGCDRTHPNYAVVRAAVILNMVALVLGIVLTVVAIAVVGVEWVLLQRAHSYRLVQTAVVEGSKRMALR